MQRLNNRDLAPPDFFRYTHSETGHVTTARDAYNWMDKIRAHRTANSLPPVTDAMAEDQLCKTLPPEWCSHSNNTRPHVSTRLSFGDLARGVIAYAKLALTGFTTVPQEEANRRARTCAGCYFNVNPQGCGACSQMAELVVGDVAGKKTDYDAALKACAVCGCPSKPLVHFPISILEAADPGDAKQAMFPEFCWRLKGGENYVLGAT